MANKTMHHVVIGSDTFEIVDQYAREHSVTDTTLSISGSPADAKAVGDALAEKADSSDVTALDTRVTAVEGDIDDLNEDLTALGEINPTIYDGFISSDGTIGTDSSAPVYTDRIKVNEGDELTIKVTHTETKSMWVAYASYDQNGTFISRAVLYGSSGQNYNGRVIVGSGVSFVAFSYRTFGEGITTAQISHYSDLKTVYDRIDAVDVVRLIGYLSDYPCEIGSIYNGIDNESTIRCRTQGYIPVKVGTIIRTIGNNNFSVALYKADYTFISQTPGWFAGEYIVSDVNAAYIRVTMRAPSNDTITDALLASIPASFVFIRSNIWGAIDDINNEIPSSLTTSHIVQTLADFDCEVGTIYIGEDDPSTVRCRTKGFIPMSSGKLYIKGENQCVISCYDSDKRYIQAVPISANWSKIDLTVDAAQTRYIRVVMRKPTNATITSDEVSSIASTFVIVRSLNDDCFLEKNTLASYFANEVQDCATKLKAYCTEKALVFGIVTDTHIYEAPIAQKWWHDTVSNIESVNDIYPLDSIIHLGDIINGSLPSDRSGLLLEEARDDINSIIKPTFMLVGNHDPNLFYDNGSDPINEGEMYALIERYNEIDTTIRPSGKPYWYKDYEPLGIRVIYLSAHMGDGYDKSEQSWGYPQEEVSWYSNIALNTDKQVLILSHMPFSQGYVSYVPTVPINGDEMKSATDAFVSSGGIVIGLINGHTHFDYVHNNGNFKEISLGAETNTNNASDKTGTGIYGYAPETAIQYGRTFGTLTQDLWSILVVRPASKTCKIIRFGAGDDVSWSY